MRSVGEYWEAICRDQAFGPYHMHTSQGKLVIGPDIDHTFFALGRLVREKLDLCPLFHQIWSELCIGPLRQLSGVPCLSFNRLEAPTCQR